MQFRHGNMEYFIQIEDTNKKNTIFASKFIRLV